MNFAAFTDRWVAQGTRETMRLGQKERQRILAYLLSYLATQTRRFETAAAWTPAAIEAVAIAMRRLSETVYLSMDHGQLTVQAPASDAGALAMLQYGTPLLDPVNNLAQVILSVAVDSRVRGHSQVIRPATINPQEGREKQH